MNILNILKMFLSEKPTDQKNSTNCRKENYCTAENVLRQMEIMRKVSSNIASTLSLEQVLQLSVDEMVNKMGYYGCILFLVDENRKKVYSKTISKTSYVKLALKYIDVPFNELNVSLEYDNNLIIQTIKNKKEYVSTSLSDFVVPALSQRIAELMQKITGHKIAISLPLMLRENVIGVIMFSRQILIPFDTDIPILRTFADQITVAIENARLFQENKNQIIYLQEKTQDMESLLFLNEMSSSGMEIESSVQNIMDAVPEKLGHLGIMGTILIRYSEKSKKACAYITTESDKMSEAKKYLTKPALGDYCFNANDKDLENRSLIIKSIINNKIEKSDNMIDLFSSSLDCSMVSKMQKSLKGKAFVSVPVIIRGKRKGALVFIFTKVIAEIGRRDMDLIRAFTQHVSVVMDNLHFYHHLNKNIEKLTHTKNKLKEMLSMKNDFLHIVSHQLRTPLTAMRGFISMWSEGDFDALSKIKMKEIQTRIVNNSERLNNIVNDMVMAMESEGELKVEFKPVDLKKLLAGDIEMLKPSFEKKDLYLKYKETTKNIPQIEADEKLLLNVFMNLIDNAEKYTDKGGLTIAVGQYGDNVKIKFIDTGIGLTKEDKKILFKKFSRGAKSNYINPNGSGLGLYIIKQIIRKHHGKITATSKGEGKGSTFTIVLPARQGR